MNKRHRDPLVCRPKSTLTAHEVMAKVDAENMLKLMHDLTAYMPPLYKERLARDGCLEIKLDKYVVSVTVRGRFETPTGKYGRANW